MAWKKILIVAYYALLWFTCADGEKEETDPNGYIVYCPCMGK